MAEIWEKQGGKEIYAGPRILSAGGGSPGS